MGSVLGSSKCNDPGTSEEQRRHAEERVRGYGRGEAWGPHHVGPDKDFCFF